MTHKEAPTLFFEVQQFRKHWFWLLLLVAPLTYFAGLLLYQLYTGKLVGDNPASNTDLALLLLIYGAFSYVALFYVKLTTVIKSDRINYGWNVPTGSLHKIKIEDIASCEVINYRFVGYGYRISLKYGIVYNVWGNKGLFIKKTNGKKILIGTQNPEEMAKAIELIIKS